MMGRWEKSQRRAGNCILQIFTAHRATYFTNRCSSARRRGGKAFLSSFFAPESSVLLKQHLLRLVHVSSKTSPLKPQMLSFAIMLQNKPNFNEPRTRRRLSERLTGFFSTVDVGF